MTANTSMPFLTVIGFVTPKGKLELQPAFLIDQEQHTLQARRHDVDKVGAESLITVELADVAGDVLVRTHVYAEPLCSYPGGNAKGKELPLFLNATVPFPKGTQTIRFCRSRRTIHEIHVPAAPPSIRLLWNPPEPPGSVIGREIVSWTAEHPEGVALRYVVLYSSDGGQSWVPASLLMQDNCIELDFDLLPAGQGKLKVVATDGVNTAVAETPRFNVGRHVVPVDPAQTGHGDKPAVAPEPTKRTQ